MTIRRNLPAADARGTTSRTLTLGDLRELVEVSGALPDDLIVRCQVIPFHMPDLGNPLGGRAMVLSLDDGGAQELPTVYPRRGGKGRRKFADGSD